MELPQDYNPSLTFDNTNALYGNHYKFTIDRLPDLTFYVQSVQTSSVEGGQAIQPNPFSNIHHPGEKLSYGNIEVSYLIDAQFKNYFSLYYWMKGYGFPHSFEEVVQFREKQQTLIPNMRPIIHNIETTHAVLSVLTPDTSAIVAEIHYEGLFPINLTPLQFQTTDSDAPLLSTTCTFSCSVFDIRLTPES
jgi:hypothetical protein